MIMCQLCNVTSQMENLIENRFLSKLLEEDTNLGMEDETKDTEEEKKCTSCHDNVTATSWCVECEEFICQNCVMVSCVLSNIHISYRYRLLLQQRSVLLLSVLSSDYEKYEFMCNETIFRLIKD